MGDISKDQKERFLNWLKLSKNDTYLTIDSDDPFFDYLVELVRTDIYEEKWRDTENKQIYQSKVPDGIRCRIIYSNLEDLLHQIFEMLLFVAEDYQEKPGGK